MKLPNTAHTSHPWRIHDIAEDFDLVDVWALPTPGGPDDFPRLVRLATAIDPSRNRSFLVRSLFAVRVKLGRLLGWDDASTGIDSRVPSLRDRVPSELRGRLSGPEFDAVPFTPLYMTHDEFAAETANKTVHGVLHLGWVPDDSGGYRGQMAILVRPNGPLGRAYMTAIAPFRYLIVYPTMLREFGRKWREQTAEGDRPVAHVGAEHDR